MTESKQLEMGLEALSEMGMEDYEDIHSALDNENYHKVVENIDLNTG